MDIAFGRKKKLLYLLFYPGEHEDAYYAISVIEKNMEELGYLGDATYLNRWLHQEIPPDETIYIMFGPEARDVLLGVRIIFAMISQQVKAGQSATRLKRGFVRHVYPEIQDFVHLLRRSEKIHFPPPIIQ